jgi:predicted protein tyrosine phosphatase
MKDEERLLRIVQGMDMRHIVEITSDPDMKYSWRPHPDRYRELGVTYTLIEDCYDDGESIDFEVFDKVFVAVLAALANGENVLVHCAAGLRRSPHAVYAVLRRLGHNKHAAWWMVHQSRPWADQHKPYIDSAERWVVSRI